MNVRETYLAFIERQTYTPIFNQPWWLDMVYGPSQWQVIYSQNIHHQQVAFPFGITNRAVFTFIRPPLLMPYMWQMNDIQISDINQLLKLLPKVSTTTITSYPIDADQVDILPNATVHPTYILDLFGKNSHEILLQCTKERQRHIKKAFRTLQFDDNTFDIDIFISHHQKSFIDKGKSYPYNKDVITKLLTAAKHHNALYTCAALLEGSIIGQVACVYDDRCMYYLLGSKDGAFTSYNALSGLLFKAIEQSVQLGLHQFDFEGSKDPGIAAFFAKFGAHKKIYLSFQGSTSSAWKIVQMLRK